MYMHAAVRHRDGAEPPRARDGRSRRMPTAPGLLLILPLILLLRLLLLMLPLILLQRLRW